MQQLDRIRNAFQGALGPDKQLSEAEIASFFPTSNPTQFEHANRTGLGAAEAAKRLAELLEEPVFAKQVECLLAKAVQA